MPERICYDISEPDQALVFLRENFGVRRMRIRTPLAADWALTSDILDAGSFRSGLVVVPGEAHYRISAGENATLISYTVAGRSNVTRGRDTAHYRTGDTFICNSPDADWDIVADEESAAVVVLSHELIEQVRLGAPDPVGQPWRPALHEIPSGSADFWLQVIHIVDRLLACDDAVASPLVVGNAGRLLAATAVTLFADATSDPTSAEVPARPGSLRRAIAFIESNADRNISLIDIAAATSVTPRALQLAFRRHLDTTPMAYLRQVRLSHAHEDLRRAGAGVTIADVAYRWGFSAPGRFARYYRAAYGVSPRDTLRSS